MNALRQLAYVVVLLATLFGSCAYRVRALSSLEPVRATKVRRFFVVVNDKGAPTLLEFRAGAHDSDENVRQWVDGATIALSPGQTPIVSATELATAKRALDRPSEFWFVEPSVDGTTVTVTVNSDNSTYRSRYAVTDAGIVPLEYADLIKGDGLSAIIFSVEVTAAVALVGVLLEIVRWRRARRRRAIVA